MEEMAKKEMTEVAKNIKMLRKARGWSRVILAERMGSTPGYVAQLETANRNPSPITIQRLCDAFGESELVIRFGELNEIGRAAQKVDPLIAALPDTPLMHTILSVLPSISPDGLKKVLLTALQQPKSGAEGRA